MEKSPIFSDHPEIVDLKPGTLLDERFQIVSRPVRRSHTFAFQVKDRAENGRIKIILLIPEVIRRDAEAMPFLVEQSRILSLLRHPAIARLYGLHSEGTRAYIETEFVPGLSLKSLKSRKLQGRFSEGEVVHLGEQMLSALAHAHDQNILHRDLKPQNIILTPEQKLKLIDFGLSEPIRQAFNFVSDTRSSTMILYWSPEQVSGKPLTVQSDIYTVGAVMYHLLAGSPPFFSGDVYHCILYQQPRPIEGISEGMNQILLKALAKDPAERFQTCREMLTELKEIGEIRYHRPRAQKAQEQSPETGEEYISVFRRLWKPQYRYSLLSTLLVIFMVILYRNLSPSSPEGAPAHPGQSHTTVDSFQIRMYRALLQQVREKIKQGALIFPAGNNAYTVLQEAGRIDSTSADWRALRDSLKQMAIERLEQTLPATPPGEAQQVLDYALTLFPSDPRLRAWQYRISHEQRPRIEILNGMGVKGVAHRIAERLEKEGYQVVYVENYRPDGRINWQQPRTLFRGILSPEKEVLNLSLLLGIDYRQEKDFKAQSGEANLQLLLGRDYQRLKILR